MRFTWSQRAQAQMSGYMADQDGMQAINLAVLALAEDPEPSEAFVRGAYHRLRVGAYRLMYEVETDRITITRVDRVD